MSSNKNNSTKNHNDSPPKRLTRSQRHQLEVELSLKREAELKVEEKKVEERKAPHKSFKLRKRVERPPPIKKASKYANWKPNVDNFDFDEEFFEHELKKEFAPPTTHVVEEKETVFSTPTLQRKAQALVDIGWIKDTRTRRVEQIPASEIKGLYDRHQKVKRKKKAEAEYEDRTKDKTLDSTIRKKRGVKANPENMDILYNTDTFKEK